MSSLAPIAQLVEQLPLKEMVLGSNPSGRTSSKKQTALLFRALVRAGAIFCICKTARRGREAFARWRKRTYDHKNDTVYNSSDS